MYVRNDTNIAILYTVVGGGVNYGTILPGQEKEVETDSAPESISLAPDDGSSLPDRVRVTLALR